MIHAALGIYLAADAGIIAIAGTAIHSPKLPQDPVLPALTFFLVHGASEIDNDGDVGLADSLFQISAWSMDVQTARELLQKVRIAIAGKKLTVNLGGAQTLTMNVVAFDTIAEQYEEDTQIHQVPCHVRIWHEEATT